MKKSILSLLLLAVAGGAQAQRVDFDMTGRQTKEVTETGFSSWQIGRVTTASSSFENDEGRKIRITVSCGDDATGKVIEANWNKAIVQSGTRLAGDGIAIKGFDGDNRWHLDTSTTLRLTLENLTEGTHSILTYHNIHDGKITSAPLSITINGEVKATGITASQQVASNSDATMSWVEFSVGSDGKAIIDITSHPEDGKTYGTCCPYLNAIVLDRPDPNASAYEPFPLNGDLHAPTLNGTLTLSWRQSNPEAKSLVYMGNDEDNLTHVITTEDTTATLTDIKSDKIYYWRVDQQTADGTITEGDLWMFLPRRLAFPGAEGYGRFAIGGRSIFNNTHGTVYHVTKLSDTPGNPQPGEFRYGIEKIDGPRTIVFDVAGIIYLKARLPFGDPYITVAGNTAPGNGILFRGSPIGVAGDNIMRYIRMLRGFHNDDPSDYNRGCDGIGAAGADHTIVDHCSTGWTIDEAFSSRGAKNLTLQRSLLAESLNNANHPNYASGKCHGFAATISGDTGTFHHNLLAHNEGRNWSLGGALDGNGYYAGHMDLFNNVCYNWGGRATDGGTHEGNFVNNYYRMGPSTTQTFLLRAQLEGVGKGSQSYYVKGNIRDNNRGTLTEDKEGVTYRYELSNGQVLDWDVWVDEPFFPSYAKIESARLALKTVLSDVGVNMPFQSAYEERIINESLNGKFTYKGSLTKKIGLIDRESDVGGYETIEYIERPADWDTDQDGMPNWWEKLNGSDPEASDFHKDSDGDGYNALEEYLHWISSPHQAVLAGTTVNIDLTKLFKGFKNNPTFTIATIEDLYNNMYKDVSADLDVASTTNTTLLTGNYAAGNTIDNIVMGKGIGDGAISNNPEQLNATISGTTLTITIPANLETLATLCITATDADNVGSMTRQLNLRATTDAQAAGIDKVITASDPNATYSIYAINGTLIAHGKANQSASALSPLPANDFSQLPAGIYILKAHTTNGTQSYKIVKK